MRKTTKFLSSLGIAACATTGAMGTTGCGYCFVRGTRIRTPRGEVPIEQLAVGDAVLGYSHERSETVECQVLASMQAVAAQTVSVRCGDAFIRGVTTEHPFWDVALRAYRRTADLSPASVLLALGPDGHTAPRPLDALEVTRHRDDVEVFNITVEQHHNYFAEGLLVHNKQPAICEIDGEASYDLEECCEAREQGQSVEDISGGALECENGDGDGSDAGSSADGGG